MAISDFDPTQAKHRRTGSRRAKVAVTVPDALLARARERVREGESPSLSALVTQALEEKLERDRLQEILDEMDAEYGAPTPEDIAWADLVLDG